MTDTLDLLGGLIEPGAQRDAVHIAVAPVQADEPLTPGDHIGFMYDGDKVLVGTGAKVLLGIVDPYLREPVNPYDRFFMFLYPQTITSLRHQWEHPAFAESDAEKWLRAFAAENGADYDDMVEGAKNAEGYCFGDTSGPEQANTDEFWTKVEAVTGKKFDEDHRERTHFRCAC